jgi:uncharacterized membrane protein
MAATGANSNERLAFLDWVRGLAAFIMLQGHTFDSFVKPSLRDSGAFVLSQFVGGVAPAIFLFLTGITFAFLMDSQTRREPNANKRVLKALRRSGYLFLLAFLFRLQLFLFGYPNSPAAELFKVDILNCMGLAMLLFAPMAVFTTFERIRLCTVLGFTVAALSPLVSAADTSAVPSFLKAYFVPSFKYFSFFPWASFLAFGMAAGSILRYVPKPDFHKVIQWSMKIGIVLILAGQYFSNIPYSLYPKSEFWLDSPGLASIKLGVVLVVLSIAFLWSNLAGPQHWSLFRQLGRTSLLVYWVHIELVYGRWFGFWKEQLSITQTVVFAAILIIAMTLLSLLRTDWAAFRNWISPQPIPSPDRASGD